MEEFIGKILISHQTLKSLAKDECCSDRFKEEFSRVYYDLEKVGKNFIAQLSPVDLEDDEFELMIKCIRSITYRDYRNYLLQAHLNVLLWAPGFLVNHTLQTRFDKLMQIKGEKFVRLYRTQSELDRNADYLEKILEFIFDNYTSDCESRSRKPKIVLINRDNILCTLNMMTRILKITPKEFSKCIYDIQTMICKYKIEVNKSVTSKVDDLLHFVERRFGDDLSVIEQTKKLREQILETVK